MKNRYPLPVYIIFKLLGFIPSCAAWSISSVLGTLLYRILKKHRRIVKTNMRLSFPDKRPHQIEKLARRVFINNIMVLFEGGWSLHLSPSDFDTHFTIDGRTHLTNTFKRKKGVLLLTAHIGNWELLPISAKMLGIKANIIYRPLDSNVLNKFFKYSRTRFGSVAVPNKKAMRPIMKALKQNECVSLLMDQNVDVYEGVFTDFFGRPACTSKGLAMLALRTGAAVVPAFLIRNGKNEFLVKMGPEIPLIQTGSSQKDIYVNTVQYTAAIEDIVRQYPEQWLWLHQRWKTKPIPPAIKGSASLFSICFTFSISTM